MELNDYAKELRSDLLRAHWHKKWPAKWVPSVQMLEAQILDAVDKLKEEGGEPTTATEQQEVSDD